VTPLQPFNGDSVTWGEHHCQAAGFPLKAAMIPPGVTDDPEYDDSGGRPVGQGGGPGRSPEQE